MILLEIDIRSISGIEFEGRLEKILAFERSGATLSLASA
jgi:hypothetical protein